MGSNLQSLVHCGLRHLVIVTRLVAGLQRSLRLQPVSEVCDHPLHVHEWMLMITNIKLHVAETREANSGERGSGI